MKRIILWMLCALFFAACKTGEDSGLPSQNLFLYDATFDVGGNASLNGWTYGRSDIDSMAHFSNDVPPQSGAKWSLALSPGWLPFTESVYRDFPYLAAGIYKLTLWAKVTGQGQGRGTIYISPTHDQPWQPSVSAIVTDTAWKEITLLDTLKNAADTTSIVLTGGSTEIASWMVLYNDITFERLP